MLQTPISGEEERRNQLRHSVHRLGRGGILGPGSAAPSSTSNKNYEAAFYVAAGLAWWPSHVKCWRGAGGAGRGCLRVRRRRRSRSFSAASFSLGSAAQQARPERAWLRVERMSASCLQEGHVKKLLEFGAWTDAMEGSRFPR